MNVQIPVVKMQMIINYKISLMLLCHRQQILNSLKIPNNNYNTGEVMNENLRFE